MKQTSRISSLLTQPLLITGTVLIIIISIAIAISLQGVTLIRGWIPLALASGLALLSGLTFWRLWPKVTGNNRFVVNFLTNFIFFTSLFTGTFYLLNTLLLTGVPSKEKVRVEKKYRERHHRSQRVGRSHFVSGRDYYEYYIEVKFHDGTTKSIELPWKSYKGIKANSYLTLTLQRGVLGADVILKNEIARDNPEILNERKGRCRFFGTSGRKESED